MSTFLVREIDVIMSVNQKKEQSVMPHTFDKGIMGNLKQN